MAINLYDELGEDRGIFQWDTNRMVWLDEDDKRATRVDFAQYNRKGDTISTEVFTYKGKRMAMIPNVFLQDARDILAYSVRDVVCGEDEIPEGCECRCCGSDLYTYSETINVYQIQVFARNRPPDYVYVDTECINLEWWKRYVNEQIKKAGIGDYKALENKPSINGVELEGNLTLSNLGLHKAAKKDIAKLFNKKKEA